MRVRQMAERPQRFVREAVVVAGFLFFAQPDAAKQIRGVARGHFEATACVRRLAIGGSAAVRDPHARARAHDRFERRHQSARRMLDDDLTRWPALVNARLAIREDDDAIALEVRAQRLAQPRRRPWSGGRPLDLRRVRHVVTVRVGQQMNRDGTARQRSDRGSPGR